MASPTKGDAQAPPSKRGWLLKWTNYMKGFQKRYFVLEKGVLAYYRAPEDIGYSCRGTLRLSDAQIEPHMGHNFMVHAGPSHKHGQSFHLRATSDSERSDWIGILNLAKQIEGNRAAARDSRGKDDAEAFPGANASMLGDVAHADDSGDEEAFYSDEESEELAMHRIPDDQELSKRVNAARAAAEKSEKAMAQLKAAEQQAEASQVQAAADATLSLVKNAMKLAAVAETHNLRWKRLLSASEAKRKQLEDALENTAKDHRRLEIDARRVKSGRRPAVDSAGEDEFFDAEEEEPEPTAESAESAEPADSSSAVVSTSSAQEEDVVRRTSIPFKPNKSASLWSIMKNSIGKDLSKIAMPVNFNEPISFTQRISEDLEYTELLDEAVRCEDGIRRMALVAAFTMSSFASGAHRTGKPFNPLLGETFELDRLKSKGYRAIVEQVSHHPPICALHAESSEWIFWQEFSMDSKFRGKYLEVIPTGISHLIFKKSKDHYTWKKVNTTIHNIIVGKLWMENHGEMTIKNHTSGITCDLDYKAYSIFSSAEPRLVVGTVKDASGQTQLTLKATWDKYMAIAEPGNESNMTTIWERRTPLPNFEKMYGFTRMAMESNEITAVEAGCAITDSRFRVDKTFMEQCDFDMANRAKVLLEEAQRYRRRQFEATKTRWTPAWFELRDDPTNPGRRAHQYKGGYWEARASGFKDTSLTDIYDITPVVKKDLDGAKKYQELIPKEYRGKGAKGAV